MNPAPIEVGPDRDDYVRRVYSSLEAALKHAVDFRADSCTLSFSDAIALQSLLVTSEAFAWRDSARLNCLDEISGRRGGIWVVKIHGEEVGRDRLVRGAIDQAISKLKK